MMIYFDGSDFLIGIFILFALLPVAWWWKRNLSYLLFFSLFWLYLLEVVSVIVFPVAISTDYSVTAFKPSINLVPFHFGNCFILVSLCLRSIIENIVLTLPFGFGINFLIPTKSKSICWLALAVGILFELSQLAVALVFQSGFRVIDINDVLLNSTGVLIGYGLFRLFAWLYLKMTTRFAFPHKLILADLYEIALQAQLSDRSKTA